MSPRYLQLPSKLNSFNNLYISHHTLFCRPVSHSRLCRILHIKRVRISRGHPGFNIHNIHSIHNDRCIQVFSSTAFYANGYLTCIHNFKLSCIHRRGHGRDPVPYSIDPYRVERGYSLNLFDVALISWVFACQN
ncbi:hypothetical protein VFPPC_16757 [Pochonia chlamydosporia 170]|uniref:Uncharacterized protein n=1 Tax=Pochonia chlamydosporia 170 TaxID=1380566 RepID=A0A179F5J1_METCM|nr:hypothetical protein VFPPC_16757 [Pochonia chlamydosporia 170]OAQ60696.1 hypothetical protein VFPPC_16757 [Pochonia chlamydosporia 170]